MARRIGPVTGAGVTITEREGQQQITPSELGVTCFVGVTERGNPGEVIDCPKQRQFLQKCGTYVEDSELPNAAFDFYEASGGAGRLYVVRVTDGTEISGVDQISNRATGSGNYLDRDTGENQKQPMIVVTAKNGGRWSGAERINSFGFTIGTDLTETTLNTGETMLVDEWVGATLQLLGVTTRTYKVVANDASGLVTVEADSKMFSNLADEDPINDVAVLFLAPEIRDVNGAGLVRGARRSLSVEYTDGEEDQNLLFGMNIFSEGALVKNYPNLSLDPENKWYIDKVVNQDPDNTWVSVQVIHTGTFNSQNRPASWYEEYKSYASGTLTANIASVVSTVPNTPGNDIGFPSNWSFPSKTVRQRLTFSFTDPTTFAVSTDGAWGAEHSDLPAGTVGVDYATTLAAANRANLLFIPSFTVLEGLDPFEAGDVIVADIDPFPVDLSNGEGLLVGNVFVEGGVSQEKVLIASNTVDSITFANLPTSAPVPAGGIAANLQSSGDITFPTTGGVISLISDITGFTQLTYAAEADIGALVGTLNAEAVLAGLPGTLFSNSGDQLIIDLSTEYDDASQNTGRDQFFEGVSIPAELNIAAGISAGTPGDEFRVEAPRELRDGYDGDAPSDADYINAYNLVTSPINNLRDRGLGLVKIATPGVTTTAIQKAGVSYADSRNYEYEVEIPDTIVEETSAVAYINDTIGRNNFAVTFWPSYGNVVNPLGDGTILQNLTGARLGIEARYARDFQGYHRASAGTNAILSKLVSLPTGDRKLDEEITNKQGVNVIVKKEGNFVLWGDRTISIDTSWKFAHKRQWMSHVELTLLESFDFAIFEINDAQTRNTLIPVFREFFNREFQKRALRGGSLDEAYQLKIDDENNTAADEANGDLNASITVAIVGVVERLNISIGQAGITVS